MSNGIVTGVSGNWWLREGIPNITGTTHYRPIANVKNMLIILLIIIFGFFSVFSIFFLRNEKKYFTLPPYYSSQWLKQI
jgi:hypothetical protein